MSKKILILIAIISSVLLFSLKTNAQTQICSNLQVEDVQMQCSDADATLTADFIYNNIEYRETTTYVISNTPVCDTPEVGSQTGIIQDDRWMEIPAPLNANNDPEPFNFCFFGNVYDRVAISSNGIITFDLTVAEPNSFSSWVLNATDLLPTQNYQTNAIFAPFHDMDLNVQSAVDRITYKTIGTYPNRVFTVNFEAYQFSCNTLLSHSQIRLYETTNVIDIIILQKPICTTWNEGGLACAGIQNKSGTVAVVPPGRNTGIWEPAVGGELWRFIPDGDLIGHTLVWTDETGNVLNSNNDASITVDPQVETTYTVTATLNSECSGQQILVEQAVVTPAFQPDIATPLNLIGCEVPVGSGTAEFNIDQTDYVLNGLDPNDYTFSYYNSLADANAGTNEITVLNPYVSAGNETIFIKIVDNNDPTCDTIRSFTLTVIPYADATFTYNPTEYCTDDTNPVPDSITTSGGTFSINNGGTINALTGEIDLVNSGLGDDGTGQFTVTYEFTGDCPSQSSVNITIYQAHNAGFTYPNTVCFDGTNPTPLSITEAGGEFTVDGGASIDSATGELDLNTTTAGTTYTVTYQFTDFCATQATQQIFIEAVDDPSFSYPSVSYCNDDANPIPDSVVTPGGTFTIDNGGILLDATTGEIDLANSGLGDDGTGQFTVTYTTNGNCPSSDSMNITIELRKDATFVYPSETCTNDGNPMPISVEEANGEFSVNGGATINTSTGELDLSTVTEGQDYEISYSFGGNCQSSYQQTIHINITPTASTPTTILNSCDNGDGTANFDILSIENEIIGSQTGVTVSYYASQQDAEMDANSMETNPFLRATGNVWARVENADGCFAIVEVPLTVDNCILIIPEGFSPSSSIPENQTFNIESIKTRYPKFEIYVYNRFGNEVYKGDVTTDNWNGKLNNEGDLLPAGTYFYGIKLNDEQDIQYRGWVYLQY